MKRAIFTAAQKGGVGKTTMARGLLHYLRTTTALRVAAYDADGEVGQFLQFYGTRDEQGNLVPEQDPLKGCGFFGITASEERDMLLEAPADQPDVLLFDLPGGSVHLLGGVGNAAEATAEDAVMLFREYADAGYRCTLLHVISPMMSSSRNVIDAVQMYGDSVDHVVVKNLAFGDAADFVLFDGFENDAGEMIGGAGRREIERLGGKIIHLPRMQGRTYAMLDLYDLNFADALVSDRIGIADRARVKSWLRAFEAELAPARHLLGLDSAPQVTPPAKAHAGLRRVV